MFGMVGSWVWWWRHEEMHSWGGLTPTVLFTLRRRTTQTQGGLTPRSYLQAEVLHPLLDGGGDRGSGLLQGLGALLAAPQQPGVVGHVHGPSRYAHLSGESAGEQSVIKDRWDGDEHTNKYQEFDVRKLSARAQLKLSNLINNQPSVDTHTQKTTNIWNEGVF